MREPRARTVHLHRHQPAQGPLDAENWDRLPDRFGFDPAQEAEWRDLLGALHRAVEEELTLRPRRPCSRCAGARGLGCYWSGLR